MTVDEILGRLERVKRTGAGWIARCPAHEDRDAVALDRARATTAACCSSATPAARLEEIVAALGLRMADLFADTRTNPP